jgi:outer membrane protein
LTLAGAAPYNAGYPRPAKFFVPGWLRRAGVGPQIPLLRKLSEESPGISRRSSTDPMTRKFLPFLVLLAVVLSLTALAQSGNAAPTPNPAPAPTTAAGTRVGIINIQSAIIATNEGQRDFEALQKKFEPRQAELQKLSNEVEELKKQLQTQGDKLNDEARLNLQKSVESKQKSLQRSLEDAQSDAQQQQQELFNHIGQKLMPVLEKYAKSNGYAIIIDVSNPQTPVLWADLASTDVTKAVVEAYNAQSGIPAPPKAASSKPAGSTSKPAAAPSTTTHRPTTSSSTAPSTTPKQ